MKSGADWNEGWAAHSSLLLRTFAKVSHTIFGQFLTDLSARCSPWAPCTMPYLAPMQTGC